MQDENVEQDDFEELDDDDPQTYRFDRPPGPGRSTTLRPHQVLLPAPDLGTRFVIPQWDPTFEPKGWTYLSGFIDDTRLTRLNGNFTYLNRSRTIRTTVTVRWDPDEFRLTTHPWIQKSDFVGRTPSMPVDTGAIERSSLLRVARFLDLHTMISTMLAPDTLNSIVQHSGINFIGAYGSNSTRGLTEEKPGPLSPDDGEHP